ncbi:MAG TPA: murein biosynthesis integral membrane protein MurJ [Candidatus Limnocylindria bacterium]|nr:murein biosynthesis integral membrane protein MurJ [Candidatus Limnocylindria bacterium]
MKRARDFQSSLRNERTLGAANYGLKAAATINSRSATVRPMFVSLRSRSAARNTPRRMSQMLKSSGATAIATMLSRVLGLVREMAYANFMGVSWVAGAFAYAFQIPNLFRRLLGEGALTAAFIPIFKQKEKADGQEAMWQAANAVISGLLVAASIIVVLAIVIISLVLGVVRIDEASTILMLRLLRVMFPYLIFVCFAAVCMGMLNARGHFFVPALGAALLNVAMIASVYFIAPLMGTELHEKIFGLAIGVLVAGFAQAAFQMPLLYREGFHYRWVRPWTDPTVRAVIQRMLPATIGVAVFQINVMIASGFAFAVGPEIVAAFGVAVRLMELPQGVFGISLATYILPTLSGLAAEKKYPEFRATLRDGIAYLLFINLLATVLLIVLGEPMIRLLFEHGKFDAVATARTTRALVALAPGLIAFSCVNIFARAFYALGDTKTPMKISVFCLVLNAALTLPLVWFMKEAGLGIANTATSFVNIFLLTFALRKKLGRLDMQSLRHHIGALLLCAAGAALGAWFVRAWWEWSIGHQTFWSKVGEVFVSMLCAAVIYFAVAWAMRVPVANDFLKLVRRRAGV